MHFIETLTAKWLEVNRGLNAYCVEVSVKSHCMLWENAIGTFSWHFVVLPTASLCLIDLHVGSTVSILLFLGQENVAFSNTWSLYFYSRKVDITWSWPKYLQASLMVVNNSRIQKYIGFPIASFKYTNNLDLYKCEIVKYNADFRLIKLNISPPWGKLTKGLCFILLEV